MGLFKIKKIQIEKKVKGDKTQYFVDYFKLKSSDEFLTSVIKDLSNENRSLIVIDTDFFYDRKDADTENKILNLKKAFEMNSIHYHEVITKKDSKDRILGISVQRSKKVNSYQIGLVISPKDIEKITEIVKDCNSIYYVVTKETDTEELFRILKESQGDYEELDQLFKFNFYVDYFFRRVRINSGQETISFIDDKLQKYR